MNSLLYIDGVVMLDSCILDVTIENDLTVYGPAIPSYS